VPCSPFVECHDARPSPFVGAGVVGVVGRVHGWWGGVLGRCGRWWGGGGRAPCSQFVGWGGVSLWRLVEGGWSCAVFAVGGVGCRVVMAVGRGGWSCAVFAVRGVGWGVVMAVGGGGVVVRRVRGWWGGV
jgi:hypothetical protein